MKKLIVLIAAAVAPFALASPVSAAPVFTGTLTIDEAPPFVRDQTIHFDATFNKNAPGNREPWVEVRCVLEGGTVPTPGSTIGDSIVWFGRDYAREAVVLGDQGGSSLWQDLGYPPLTCSAHLFTYYGNPEKTALYASTPPFDVG